MKFSCTECKVMHLDTNSKNFCYETTGISVGNNWKRKMWFTNQTQEDSEPSA